jgi:hypothetical protein
MVTVHESKNGELQMNDGKQREQQDSRASAEHPLRKRPYQKPEFRRDRVFETTALSCGKIQVTQSQCKFNRKLS